MNRKNVTRSALFTSIVSLLLCVSMLVGTTFAWFTDEVVSGTNVIAAGNLDIELEYAVLNEDGTVKEWKTVSAAENLFSSNLWEPGHTEVVYLKLSNLGTLALKYQLGINAASETEGTNVAGATFKLSDYIYMGVVEKAEPSYTTREEAIAAAKTGANGIIGKGFTKSGKMEKGADALYLAVVVYMPETVGNEVNYKTGTAVPEINLGINLFATQEMYEDDSFGDDYDEDADYDIPAKKVGTVADFLAAIDEGGAIQLTSDIALEQDVTFSKPITLNLNNNTITSMGINVAADATIENGTITSGGNTNMVPHLKVTAGTLTMNNVKVDIIHHLNANSNWSEATGMEIANAKAILNNCDISINNTTKAQWVFSYAISLNNADVTINGGSVTAECVAGTAANGPTNPNAISSMGECTATLNDVKVNAMYYGTTVNGHLTINTTDNSITSANVVDNRGGSHTLNYISN